MTAAAAVSSLPIPPLEVETRGPAGAIAHETLRISRAAACERERSEEGGRKEGGEEEEEEAAGGRAAGEREERRRGKEWSDGECERRREGSFEKRVTTALAALEGVGALSISRHGCRACLLRRRRAVLGVTRGGCGRGKFYFCESNGQPCER